MNDHLTYSAAGVDTEAGDKAVELMKAAVARTHGPEVIGGVGAFAGLIDVSVLKDYRRPLLASSTDGVGTKIAIARALGVHDTIGRDLVAMVVDDIVVSGARPLLMTDYIACGKIVPERIAEIVRGVAEGCEEAGVALVGGETAEHPGLMEEDEYDLAGAAVGVVEADVLLGPDRVKKGDIVVGLASSGLHSNGYSLIRAVVAKVGWTFDRVLPETGRTLGEELLEPTRIYSRLCQTLARDLPGLRAFAHVTGGGLAANLSRVIPTGLVAVVDRSSWEVPSIFDLIQTAGDVPWTDLESTLNLGVGMAAVIEPDGVDDMVAACNSTGVSAWVLGGIRADDGDGESSSAVKGAKGAEGGAVVLDGSYRLT